jgi:hypothetical protein
MVYLNLQVQKVLMMKMMTYLGERKTHPNRVDGSASGS